MSKIQTGNMRRAHISFVTPSEIRIFYTHIFYTTMYVYMNDRGRAAERHKGSRPVIVRK